MEISSELIRKYNVPVPRYTSYPPANHFSGSFSREDHVRLLKESNQGSPRNIALYIHVPFCKKICFYCGCNACPIGTGRLVKPYMEAVKKEISIVAAYIDKNRPVSQVHYGGGTPNAVPLSLITELNEFLFNTFRFIEKPEIAIECNPSLLDHAAADLLKGARFNRFSLGIQDFDRDILRTVNREPSALPEVELLAHLKEGEEGVTVNLDFMYGLPGQTVAGFARTIEQAILLRPDRLVTFSYAHVPWLKKHQQILEKKGLPATDQKMAMFLEGHRLLCQAGYQPIGLDHYVLPEDELSEALKNRMLHRNFQGYCTRRTTGQVYAFGASAISQLEKGFSQNMIDPEAYITKISQGIIPLEKGYGLSREEILIGRVISEIMCNMHIDWLELSEQLGVSAEELKSLLILDERVLEEFVQDGLLEYSPSFLRVTPEGSLFVRNIAASLDPAYQSHTHQYSKSV